MRFPLKRAAAGVGVILLLAVACTRATDGAGEGGAAPDGAGGNAESAQEAGATTTTAFVPRKFTFGGSGDILVHVPVQRDALANGGGKVYDFNPMFDDVRPLISGVDLAICHQETPISADGKNLSIPNTVSFNAPKEIAPALKNAGFEGCDTASNHTWDRGLGGVQQTNAVLGEAGLKQVGGAGSAAEMEKKGTVYEVNGVRVGHLAYSYTIYNDAAAPNTRVPPEAPWMKGMLWPAIGSQGIVDDAKKLKEQGADFVVVSIHWGDQYIRQPNLQQSALAQDLLNSPYVDLILGDHVHVVQPCQKINDKYVIFGMGNFLSNQAPSQDRSLKPDTQDGGWYQWDITEVAPNQFKATSMAYAPTFVQTQGHKILRATPDKYKTSYDRTVSAVSSLGPLACDAKPMY